MAALFAFQVLWLMLAQPETYTALDEGAAEAPLSARRPDSSRQLPPPKPARQDIHQSLRLHLLCLAYGLGEG